MPRKDQHTKRLLRVLKGITERAHTKNAVMPKEIEKCPSSKGACAALAEALENSQSRGTGDEFLMPPASWIHPLI